MATDPRVDDYIAKAATFAKPVLEHLRALVHAALPEAEEAIKWGVPHFLVNGKNIAGMAAFKAHCGFVIHGNGRQGGSEKAGRDKDEALGRFGRITGLSELPADTELVARLHQARDRVVRTGSAVAKRPARARKPDIAMPDDFAAALAATPTAQSAYDGFAPSARREYVEWITGAKAAATREKRIAEGVEWIAQGKKRNWKYKKC